MSAMRWVWVFGLLAGCVAPVAEDTYIRAVEKPVYSIAGFDPTRLSGDWVQVAGFGRSCEGGRLQMAARLSYDLCLASGRAAGQAAPTGVPGRFEAPDGALWVLWADADDRTLVIGGPDGRMAAVLNRAGGISSDRLQAARDILGFNGYDVSQLVVY